MPYCMNCGAKLDKSAHFCRFCGNMVSPEESSLNLPDNELKEKILNEVSEKYDAEMRSQHKDEQLARAEAQAKVEADARARVETQTKEVTAAIKSANSKAKLESEGQKCPVAVTKPMQEQAVQSSNIVRVEKPANSTEIIIKIRQLKKLLDDGYISSEQFTAAKDRLLRKA